MTRAEKGLTIPPGITLAPLAAGSPWLADVVQLYRATWPDGADAVTAFFTSHAAMLDYHGLVAVRDERLAGYGFGVRSLPGQWWHDRVAEQIGPEHPALRDAWLLVSLAVAPEERGRGVGAALMEALLAAQPCSRALLSTGESNTTSRRLYERQSWTYLHAGFAFFPGAPTDVVMRRELEPRDR